MAKKQTSDFRYNTGDTTVPWAAVGENYNTEDVKSLVEFMMQGSGEEYDAALAKVKASIAELGALSTPPGKLSMGSKVEKVEAEVDEYLGTTGSVFVANCTAGFEIAYKYANVGPGDEVIVPAITFIATMAYPLSVGAKLVFCDVDPVTLNMDPKDLENKITEKTKMIVPVDIGGYPVDIDAIMEIANRHNLIVLEDAAHAFGAEYKGRKIGTTAHFTGFSMHEVKNITSFGEGGILCSTIDEFKADMKRARFLGLDFGHQIKNWLYDITPCKGKYGPFVAGNSSTTEIQAVGLSLQLARNEAIIAERTRNTAYLNELLAGVEGIIPQDMGGDDLRPTFHLYRLLVDPAIAGGDVQVLKKKLEQKGVTNIPHFGPLYRFAVLKEFGYNEAADAAGCPNCEEVFDHRFTHLPIYGLTKEQIEFMANAIIESVSEMKAGK